MSMALVISVLCFVSRMRMRDQGPVNGIPISRRMFIILKRFFTRAALRGLVSDRRHPRAHSLQLIITRADSQQRGGDGVLPWGSE